ncbi:acyltransferase, partial [Schleiferiaceae bacterium]|nr:acyltransferase [Schleiferiaceae bacterium]
SRQDMGVKIFFALSGFILTLPLVRSQKTLNLSFYYKRRLRRLEPPYILVLFSFGFFQVVSNYEEFLVVCHSFIAGLFYSSYTFSGIPNPINPVTWSLEIEAYFYILMPFIVYLVRFLARKLNLLISLGVLSVLFIAMKYLIVEESFLSHTIFYYLINFHTGICFAYFYFHYIQKVQKNYFMDFLGLLVYFGMLSFYKPQAEMGNIVFWNVSMFCFFVSVFKGKVLNKLFTNRFVYVVGGMCYSIYLLHYGLYYLISPILFDLFLPANYETAFLLGTLVIIPFTLLISSVFYLIVEKPFMVSKTAHS